MFVMKKFKKILSIFLTASLSLGSASVCMASETNTAESKIQSSAEKKETKKIMVGLLKNTQYPRVWEPLS